MMGKTHYKLGIVFYCLLACMFSALGISFLGFGAVTLAGVAVAAIGGLIPDADNANSLIRSGGVINKYLLWLFKLTFVVYAAIFAGIPLFYLFNEQFRNSFHIKSLFDAVYLAVTVSVFPTIMFVLFLLRNKLKTRLLIIIPVIITAIYLNRIHKLDWISVLVLSLFVAATAFSHRGFTHSIEGFICFGLSALFLASKFGYTYLGVCFSMGYFSHLWLADFFTDEGIHMFYIINILAQKGIVSKKNKLYLICGKKRKLKLMSTSSKSGEKFELIYLTSIFMVTALLVIVLKPHFRIL